MKRIEAMKQKVLLILIMAGFLFAGCSISPDNKKVAKKIDVIGDASETPIIYFENTEHNFGKIFQGEKVSYTFKFQNIGLSDLIIKNATASCGCTVPKFPRKPIASGESADIEVIFDSSDRHGRQLKTVTVWTNCNPEKIKLQITSEIVEPN